ncbi:LOW QUALITY PROTEIN: hypothetical protein V1477_006653 [Vespula maculifrons]|uniref:Uncharacterized protein n=1 Tax=Vespula maculifrons TaxID=7453 RepID=A0ABD2CJK5_VESMC
MAPYFPSCWSDAIGKNMCGAKRAFQGPLERPLRWRSFRDINFQIFLFFFLHKSLYLGSYWSDLSERYTGVEGARRSFQGPEDRLQIWRPISPHISLTLLEKIGRIEYSDRFPANFRASSQVASFWSVTGDRYSGVKGATGAFLRPTEPPARWRSLGDNRTCSF